MSITVSATPFLLLIGAIGSLHEIVTNTIKSSKEANIEFAVLNERLKKMIKENNGVVNEEIVETLCKEYETIFIDKELLIKTLNEHGAKDFDIQEDTVRCKLESFVLEFNKFNAENTDVKEAYKMKIYTACDENGIEQMISDINEEYSLNTQEETYIKIKERLEKQGLRINEEEILDDNSIMLTINIS